MEMLPAGDGSMGTKLENFDYLNCLAGFNDNSLYEIAALPMVARNDNFMSLRALKGRSNLTKKKHIND